MWLIKQIKHATSLRGFKNASLKVVNLAVFLFTEPNSHRFFLSLVVLDKLRSFQFHLLFGNRRDAVYRIIICNILVGEFLHIKDLKRIKWEISFVYQDNII